MPKTRADRYEPPTNLGSRDCRYLTRPGVEYISTTKQPVLPPVPSTPGYARRLTREEKIADFADGLK